MNLQLALRTLYRTPLKTLMTFLLLAATSYLLSFYTAEYAVTSREYERAAGYYYGVGAIEAEPVVMGMGIPGDFPFWGGIREFIFNLLPAYSTDALIYADERIEHNPYDYDA